MRSVLGEERLTSARLADYAELLANDSPLSRVLFF